jgi:hypothetical protein
LQTLDQVLLTASENSSERDIRRTLDSARDQRVHQVNQADYPDHNPPPVRRAEPVQPARYHFTYPSPPPRQRSPPTYLASNSLQTPAHYDWDYYYYHLNRRRNRRANRDDDRDDDRVTRSPRASRHREPDYW